jgi:hypothetical protein
MSSSGLSSDMHVPSRPKGVVAAKSAAAKPSCAGRTTAAVFWMRDMGGRGQETNVEEGKVQCGQRNAHSSGARCIGGRRYAA